MPLYQVTSISLETIRDGCLASSKRKPDFLLYVADWLGATSNIGSVWVSRDWLGAEWLGSTSDSCLFPLPRIALGTDWLESLSNNGFCPVSRRSLGADWLKSMSNDGFRLVTRDWLRLVTTIYILYILFDVQYDYTNISMNPGHWYNKSIEIAAFISVIARSSWVFISWILSFFKTNFNDINVFCILLYGERDPLVYLCTSSDLRVSAQWLNALLITRREPYRSVFWSNRCMRLAALFKMCLSCSKYWSNPRSSFWELQMFHIGLPSSWIVVAMKTSKDTTARAHPSRVEVDIARSKVSLITHGGWQW